MRPPLRLRPEARASDDVSTSSEIVRNEVFDLGQKSPEGRPRAGRPASRDRGRRTLDDERSAAVASFRPQVDDMAGPGDQIEVVLDGDDRMSGGKKLPEEPQQPLDVGGMKPGRRFVE